MSVPLLLDSASAVRLPVPAGKPVQRAMLQDELLEPSHSMVSTRSRKPLIDGDVRSVVSFEVVAPVEEQIEYGRVSQLRPGDQ